jgi:hypothetical protein
MKRKKRNRHSKTVTPENADSKTPTPQLVPASLSLPPPMALHIRNTQHNRPSLTQSMKRKPLPPKENRVTVNSRFHHLYNTSLFKLSRALHRETDSSVVCG